MFQWVIKLKGADTLGTTSPLTGDQNKVVSVPKIKKLIPIVVPVPDVSSLAYHITPIIFL